MFDFLNGLRATESSRNYVQPTTTSTPLTTGDFARFDRGQTASAPKYESKEATHWTGLSEQDRKALAAKMLANALTSSSQATPMHASTPNFHNNVQAMGGGQMIGGR